jgi:acetyl-CoA carboxylase carboxyl transferase subunit alpha
MIRHFLDFERPLGELEGKIEELRHLSTTGELNIAEEVGRLEASAARLLRQTYARLTPWQRCRWRVIPNARTCSTMSAA